MKWIRKYKENIDDILELTKNCLIYMLDSGKFQIGSSTNLTGDSIITIEMIQTSQWGNSFSFSSIREEIIPLITILQYKYSSVELELVQRNFVRIKVDTSKLEVVKYNTNQFRTIIIKVN